MVKVIWLKLIMHEIFTYKEIKKLMFIIWKWGYIWLKLLCFFMLWSSFFPHFLLIVVLSPHLSFPLSPIQVRHFLNNFQIFWFILYKMFYYLLVTLLFFFIYIFDKQVRFLAKLLVIAHMSYTMKQSVLIAYVHIGEYIN